MLDEEQPIKVKIGTAYWQVPFEQGKRMTGEMLEQDQQTLDKLMAELGHLREKSEALKGPLKAKFGDSIRLDA